MACQIEVLKKSEGRTMVYSTRSSLAVALMTILTPASSIAQSANPAVDPQALLDRLNLIEKKLDDVRSKHPSRLSITLVPKCPKGGSTCDDVGKKLCTGLGYVKSISIGAENNLVSTYVCSD